MKHSVTEEDLDRVISQLKGVERELERLKDEVRGVESDGMREREKSWNLFRKRKEDMIVVGTAISSSRAGGR